VAVTAVEVEIECSDESEHRRRVEHRRVETPGITGPSWDEVVSRDYRAWDRERIVIDTARDPIDQSVAALLSALPTG
jgi:hypothetical protein